MIKVLWVPTWRCNLLCDYCGYLETIKSRGKSFSGWQISSYAVEEREPEFWYEVFREIEPTVIDASGGEPTLYPLAEVISRLPQHTFSFTSNLLGNVEPLLSLPNVGGFTCSYHYLGPEKAKQKFLRRLAQVRERKGVSVTLVATQARLGEFERAVAEIRATGATAQVHMEFQQGSAWPPELVERVRASGLRVVEGTERWRGGELGRTRLCQGGWQMLTFGPDGRMFRCFAHMHANLPLQERLRDAALCSTPCYFPCDWSIPKSKVS